MEAPSQAGQQSVDKQDDRGDLLKIIDCQQVQIETQKEAMLSQSREIVQLREQLVEHGYIPKVRL